jgi:hypothetical protein
VDGLMAENGAINAHFSAIYRFKKVSEKVLPYRAG